MPEAHLRQAHRAERPHGLVATQCRLGVGDAQWVAPFGLCSQRVHLGGHAPPQVELDGRCVGMSCRMYPARHLQRAVGAHEQACGHEVIGLDC